MKEIASESLTENICYSGPVYIEEKFIIAAPELPITADLIQRLKKWDIKSVYTDGEPCQPSSINNEAGSDAEQIKISGSVAYEEKDKNSMRFFVSACEYWKKIYSRFKNSGEIRRNEIIDELKNFYYFIRDNKEAVLNFYKLRSNSVNYLAAQSVKTTILVIVLADFLKIPFYKILELAQAAFLHKIGMAKLPENITDKAEKLSPEEWKAIKVFPIFGFKILQAAKFSNPVCLAVLEQQERNDGSGYPRQLRSEKISAYGKILAAASSYCASTGTAAYRKTKNGHAAIMDILNDMATKYDDKIIRALIVILSIYPIGSMVRLSNNSVAVIVKATGNPRTPVIKVITDETGKKLKEQIIIDLSKNSKIGISKILE